MKPPIFLKWVGGKRRLIEQLSEQFPNKFETYYEPFLGAGSIFFYLKAIGKAKTCVLSDINQDLVSTYIAVRDKPTLLINHLKWFKTNHSKKFYYETREKFNKKKYLQTRRCAAFIYLNKTCFNGIYRVNKKNEFNVPMGKYKNPEIFNEKDLKWASELLQDVEIRCQDYRDILPKVKKNDFVYLDPCYDPLKKTSFAHYTPERFQLSDRYKLYSFIIQINQKGAHFLLSNNDIEEVKTLYKKHPEFKINEVYAHRFINSDKAGRGQIRELAISNT